MTKNTVTSAAGCRSVGLVDLALGCRNSDALVASEFSASTAIEGLKSKGVLDRGIWEPSDIFEVSGVFETDLIFKVVDV